MFAVIKRFMFRIRRAVWISVRSQIGCLLFPGVRAKIEIFDTISTAPNVHLVYIIIQSDNKYTQLQSLHWHSGTEGGWVNVQHDGYKSNNQLCADCCLSASFWSIASCGTRVGWASNVIIIIIMLSYYTHPGQVYADKKKKTLNAAQFFTKAIHIKVILHLWPVIIESITEGELNTVFRWI